MSLFGTAKKGNEEIEDDEEDDLLNEIDKLMLAIKDQTKIIKEMAEEIKKLREDQTELQIELKESIRNKDELTSVKSQLYDMMCWVQAQFVTMLENTKEKAEERKPSPAVQAYINRKNNANNGKLPLPG